MRSAVWLGLLALTTPIWGQQSPIGRSAGGDTRRPLDVLYIRGQVQLANGGAPPLNTVIERLCFGQIFPDGFTDTDGKFNVRVGSDGSAAVMDASMSGTDKRGRPLGDPTQSGGLGGQTDRMTTMKGTGTVDLTGCELRANLPGYRSTAVPLGRRSLFENQDVGTIVLRRIEGVTGTTVSVTLLEAPPNARKAFETGAKELGKPSPNNNKAADQLAKAVTIYPRFAAAWSMLGRVRARLGDEFGANQAYAAALAIDPKYLEPYLPMVKLRIRAGDWTAARMYADNLLMLNPHEAEAYFYKALACLQLEENAAAEDALVRLAAATGMPGSRPYPQAHHLMGIVLAQRGEFASAAEKFRTFLTLAPDSPQAPDVRKNLAEWEEKGLVTAPEPQP